MDFRFVMMLTVAKNVMPEGIRFIGGFKILLDGVTESKSGIVFTFGNQVIDLASKQRQFVVLEE